MDMVTNKFADRSDAGRRLARLLADMELDHPLIYALPRGGVSVGVEVAKRLSAPLDLLLVRKIGAQRNPEVAFSALVEGADEQTVINEDVWRSSGANDAYVAQAAAQRAELERLKALYLRDRTRPKPNGRTVVVVDDGLATGATMKAALIGLKRSGPARIVVALPVAPKQALEEISDQADDILCIYSVTSFRGVGAFYQNFHQLPNDETVGLLNSIASNSLQTAVRFYKREVAIPPLGLTGDLIIPKNPHGIILFAHGSGSNRRSPRNTYVAEKLNEEGFATLLLDLMTPVEAKDRRNVFDIPLLADRMVEASIWITSEPDLEELPLGVFGASTGAAAALVTAAELRGRIAAVVSRGGRPDLAMEFLPQVQGPTLLIVGGRDSEVLALNEHALAALSCKKELMIVPGAGHLFEEPGTLRVVIEHAADWFRRYLRAEPFEIPKPMVRLETATTLPPLRTAAEPLPAINDPAFAKNLDRFGSKRVVLLGETSHGIAEFYTARNAITRRLIEEHGFSILAVEADWSDTASVDHLIRQKPFEAMKDTPFAQFPTWMWRNENFASFTRFLKQHNCAKSIAERVAFLDLDLYNMNDSIAELLAYLDRVDEKAAAVASSRFACLTPWSRAPAAYGRAAMMPRLAVCEQVVTQILADLLKSRLEHTQIDGDQFFDATQNARFVANAER